MTSLRTLALLAVQALAAAAAFALISDAHAQASVQGTVTDAAGHPVPGVVVTVVNRERGRSRPAYSNAQGRYALSDIPASAQPYDLELYWGDRLVYRRTLAANSRDNLAADVVLK